jgi:hypothetical protein
VANELVQVHFHHDNYPLPAAPGPQGVSLTPENVKIAKVLKLEETTGLIKDVAGLVAGYAVDIIDRFGAEEWMRYYRVDVGPEPELSDEFYDWWLSPDVIEPDKLNCDTHLPPVLRPQYVRKAALNIPLTLDTLGYLAQHPKEGPPSRYDYDTVALWRHGNTKAGPARWLVMRKDVFARDQSYNRQKECIQKLNAIGANYDEMPSGLDLATILFVTHANTGGDRHFGDATGKEDRWTFSRCRERVQLSDRSCFSLPMIVGGFAPGGLRVCCYDVDGEDFGVAALRKF